MIQANMIHQLKGSRIHKLSKANKKNLKEVMKIKKRKL